MVKIISDSTCDLSAELAAQYDIDILPLHILLGDEEFEDGKTITPDEIYSWSDEHNVSLSGGINKKSWSMPYRVSVGYTGPVLERRPLSICRGLLDSRREREGRWQGTRSYGPAAREALQPQA